MPTQLLLDGDDLPALLQRVRDELGPEAVVVKADRVRTGGVAGFFAKEHFEVTVEVPDAPPNSRRARRLAEASASAGMQALLAAADASDGDEHHAAARADAAPVSTEGDTFAALLASIDGGTSGTLPAPRESQDRRGTRPGASTAPAAEETDAVAAPPAARFVDEGVAVTAASFGPLHPSADDRTSAPASGSVVPARRAPAPAPPAPDEPTRPATAEPEVRAAPGSPADSVLGADERSGVQPAMFVRLPAGTPTTRDAAAVRAARRAEDVTPAPRTDDVPGTTGADAPGAHPAAPSATSSFVSPDPVAEPSLPGSVAEPDDARRALAGVGIPAALLGDVAGDALGALPRVLGRVPRPPALLRAPGSLVAVVGEGPDVVGAAREMARRAGLDPRDVALAGDLRPTDATDREVLTAATAPRQRSRTSTLGAVTVVAVAVGPDRDDRRAAAALVGALDPDQCWAVVDARRKSADLRAWMAEVAGGRRFAGAAGTRVDDTREPGTLLDLGVPVASLDGQPATPLVWAAVLGEHLDHGEPPA